MSVFVLTIHTKTKGFGETQYQEREMICHVLKAAALRIGTGHGPIAIKDIAGNDCCTYEFGDDALSHPNNHRYPDAKE